MINLPYSAMVVNFNENLKTLIKPHKRNYKFFYYFICASISGVIASILTNPLDVIKTRLQTQNTVAGVEADIIFDDVVHAKYASIVSTYQQIKVKEGLGGFVKGTFPRAMQASMSSALSWVSYEIIKHYFLGKL